MEYAVDWATRAVASVLIPKVLPDNTYSRLVCDLGGSYLVHAIGGALFYLAIAGLSFYYFFVLRKDKYYPKTIPKDFNIKEQVKAEIGYALWSIPWMAVLLTPFPLLLINGYGRVYERVEDYGWVYLVFSVVFFLVFTDGMIYFIHRALHLPMFYKTIHKPHHRFKHTTPFSSHAFHPLDGFSQGIPYYIFALLFPIQKDLFSALFVFVNVWTVSIHDQVDFCGAGLINSTGHHTLHHELFVYNYGQYFTFWDRLCGTYRAAAQTHHLKLQ
jgi:lathosterol oxidase